MRSAEAPQSRVFQSGLCRRTARRVNAPTSHGDARSTRVLAAADLFGWLRGSRRSRNTDPDGNVNGQNALASPGDPLGWSDQRRADARRARGPHRRPRVRPFRRGATGGSDRPRVRHRLPAPPGDARPPVGHADHPQRAAARGLRPARGRNVRLRRSARLQHPVAAETADHPVRGRDHERAARGRPVHGPRGRRLPEHDDPHRRLCPEPEPGARDAVARAARRSQGRHAQRPRPADADRGHDPRRRWAPVRLLRRARRAARLRSVEGRPDRDPHRPPCRRVARRPCRSRCATRRTPGPRAPWASSSRPSAWGRRSRSARSRRSGWASNARPGPGPRSSRRWAASSPISPIRT